MKRRMSWNRAKWDVEKQKKEPKGYYKNGVEAYIMIGTHTDMIDGHRLK